jgi:hypothetical protein
VISAKVSVMTGASRLTMVIGEAIVLARHGWPEARTAACQGIKCRYRFIGA